MDETIYQEVYHHLNKNRCVFEKSLTNRRCNCEMKRRFTIATREGVGCQSVTAKEQCEAFLNTMRHNARFALKIVMIDGPMPHNKELKVQAGGSLALQQLLSSKPNKATQCNNIYATLTKALVKFDSIDNLPYSEIVKGIVSFQPRPKRKKR